MALRASGSGPLMPSAVKTLNPASSPLSLSSKGQNPAQHHHTTSHDHTYQQQPAHIKAVTSEHTVELQQPHSQQTGSFWDSNDPQKAPETAAGDHMDAHGHATPFHAQHGQHGADEHIQQAAAFGNPLRQKSALGAELGEDDYVDVIPALPHVIYSEGGQIYVLYAIHCNGSATCCLLPCLR